MKSDTVRVIKFKPPINEHHENHQIVAQCRNLSKSSSTSLPLEHFNPPPSPTYTNSNNNHHCSHSHSPKWIPASIQITLLFLIAALIVVTILVINYKMRKYFIEQLKIINKQKMIPYPTRRPLYRLMYKPDDDQNLLQPEQQTNIMNNNNNNDNKYGNKTTIPSKSSSLMNQIKIKKNKFLNINFIKI